MHYALFLFSMAFLLTAVSPAAAQQPVTDDQVNEVARGLYCPVCESVPLDVCPTQACIDWRNQIRDQLAEGQTQEEIHTYFATRFGDGVLAEPPRSGVNLILWLFPVFAVVVGGLFFGRYMRGLKLQPTSTTRRVRNKPEPIEAAIEKPAARPQEPSVDYVARIEAELAND
ncbi:MAG: cytochrome c-type biogenesis protein [Chloroflexota bacterium]